MKAAIWGVPRQFSRAGLLTETVAMEDADRTLAMFTALRAIGVSLAIDDFGAGYSSLSYVKKLPFDKLKIDREFVQGVDTRPDSQAICQALVALGKGLNLSVLAEGVETKAEVASEEAVRADPALKPNHPTHNRHAPTKESTSECGGIGSLG